METINALKSTFELSIAKTAEVTYILRATRETTESVGSSKIEFVKKYKTRSNYEEAVEISENLIKNLINNL